MANIIEGHVEALREDGFVVVRSAITSALCDELEKALDLIIHQGTTWNLDRVADSVSYRDCIGLDPVFKKLIANDIVLSPGYSPLREESWLN